MTQKALSRYRSILLSNRNFKNFWLGQTISYLGNSIYNITIAWYVFDKTGSVEQVALVLLAEFLPEVLIGMFLGALTDRWNRKKLMQAGDAIRGVVTLLLALAMALHLFRFWQIYIVTIALSIAGSLFSSAQSGFVPEIVTEQQLLSANSLISVSRQINRLLGATIGGVLVAFVGASVAIAFDALTFFLSLLFIQRIAYVARNDNSSPVSLKSLGSDVKSGVQWLLKQPVLLLIILIGTVSNMALGPTNVVPAMFIKSELHANSAALGTFDTGIGLGLLLGGIVTGWLAPKRIGLWFACGLGLEGIGMLIVSVAPSLSLAWVGNFVLGFSLMLASLPMSTLLQLLTPSQMRGKINSIMSIGLNLSVPISFGAIGALAEAIGARPTYAWGGLLLVACFVAGLLNTQLRKYHLDRDLPSRQENASLVQ